MGPSDQWEVLLPDQVSTEAHHSLSHLLTTFHSFGPASKVTILSEAQCTTRRSTLSDFNLSTFCHLRLRTLLQGMAFQALACLYSVRVYCLSHRHLGPRSPLSPSTSSFPCHLLPRRLGPGCLHCLTRCHLTTQSLPLHRLGSLSPPSRRFGPWLTSHPFHPIA